MSAIEPKLGASAPLHSEFSVRLENNISSPCHFYLKSRNTSQYRNWEGWQKEKFLFPPSRLHLKDGHSVSFSRALVWDVTDQETLILGMEGNAPFETPFSYQVLDARPVAADDMDPVSILLKEMDRELVHGTATSSGQPGASDASTAEVRSPQASESFPSAPPTSKPAFGLIPAAAVVVVLFAVVLIARSFIGSMDADGNPGQGLSVSTPKPAPQPDKDSAVASKPKGKEAEPIAPTPSAAEAARQQEAEQTRQQALAAAEAEKVRRQAEADRLAETERARQQALAAAEAEKARQAALAAAEAEKIRQQALAQAEANRVQADKVARADLCDQLAANPFDKTKAANVPGVGFPAVRAQAKEAQSACADAAQFFPEYPRFKYQLARATQATNPAQAFALQSELVRQSYPAAFDNFGWLNIQLRKDYNAAVAAFQRGAQLGDPDSMVSLAEMIDKKSYFPPDPFAEKISLYKRAADLGHPGAQRALEVEVRNFQQLQQQQRANAQTQQLMMGVFGAVLNGVINNRR